MIITSKMVKAVKMMLTPMIVICNLYDGLRGRRRVDDGDSKNTIRDVGSTALYTAYTISTTYTIQTTLHCLNSSMYAYIHYREP